jgi:hypothetical protein
MIYHRPVTITKSVPEPLFRVRAHTISDDGVGIGFGRAPIRLPHPVDELARSVIATRKGHATIGAATPSLWLFPGGQPGRPISTERLELRLRDDIRRAARSVGPADRHRRTREPRDAAGSNGGCTARALRYARLAHPRPRRTGLSDVTASPVAPPARFVCGESRAASRSRHIAYGRYSDSSNNRRCHFVVRAGDADSHETGARRLGANGHRGRPRRPLERA